MIKIFEYFLKKEIPVLMYHRLINNKGEIGKNTIYLNVDEFEKQLKYLKGFIFTMLRIFQPIL